MTPATTDAPSSPLQRKRGYGQRVCSFHCSFVVAKYGTPACAASDGNVEGKPNVSGSHATVGVTPSVSRVHAMPCANWRRIDSPLGACTAGSTHIVATLASQ